MLKKFDIFPKAENNELSVKTKTGGLLSIISVVFLILFIFIDFKKFALNKTFLQMTVSQEPFPSTMRFHLDIYVYNNCSTLHVDFTNQKRTFMLLTDSEQNFKQEKDRCHLIIDAEPPTVPGSMHIGLGTNYFGNDKHQHSYLTLENTNLSHIINNIQIGDFTSHSSLDSSSLILSKPYLYMINYDVQLVPVFSDHKCGFEVLADLAKTNLDRNRNSKGIPAIIFDWNFSPLQLEKTTEYGSFITFLSKILALFGAFFVFIRWYDRILYNISKKTE